jgi:hypothetical protein
MQIVRFATECLFVFALAGAAPALAHGKCRIKNPDISISGVTLTQRESAVAVVGSGANLVESEEDLPHARFVSSNGAQELVLFAPYGAVEDEYSEVEVRAAGPEALVLKDLPVDTFKTGRGVELGMTAPEVEALFGNCFKSREKKGQELFFEYEIDAADRDPDLKTYGFPVYFAEYEFEKGKLTRFRFGFAYP